MNIKFKVQCNNKNNKEINKQDKSNKQTKNVWLPECDAAIGVKYPKCVTKHFMCLMKFSYK